MIHHRTIGGALLAAVLSAGCSGGQPAQPFVANQALPTLGSRSLKPNTSTSAYRVVYNFGSNGTDAAWPQASVTEIKGALYGVAWGGGFCSYNSGETGGCGSVFKIGKDGTERVLHSFGGTNDGLRPGPGATLLDVNGTLYGTTQEGGPSNNGIVYSLSLSGDEKILHDFGSPITAAQLPEGAFIDVNGTLYGTTWVGGKYHNENQSSYDFGGTAYSIDPTSGAFRKLHDFGQGEDGQILFGGLLDVNGTFYGVTSAGGKDAAPGRGGTVFSLSRKGTEKVLHSFGGSGDGSWPFDSSGLIDVNGTLYGTTEYGGAHNLGTVFSISPTSGTEQVLHSFGASGDGADPEAGLIDVKGTLYGTTTAGGKYYKKNSPLQYGGTLFSISLTGTEQVLHNFGDGTDGQNPQGAPLDVNGTLYGTTTWGGKNNCVPGFGSGGTVYAFTLPTSK
ncbi:MAG TPA: choice-of-anchor tandem repeat GloVer-containing protein [Candidatus Tumulicola sp.]